ncbi:hypothetical protein [Actinomycetospora aeridis]|uniref:Uncharacterized protein n=1 Tax=Actinomycetospora aeridis TaxID=3129231 RepID=A0ABU8MZX1_9PSEU
MGAHSARQASTVGKVAGRGALTAAAALALTGGTASFAFAAEAPNFDNSSHTVEDVVSSNIEGLQEVPEAPQDVKDVEELVGGHVHQGKEDVGRITSAVTSDVQTNLNAAGVPVDSHLTDGEQEVTGQVSALTGRVQDATGAGAQQIDDAIASHGSSVLSFGGDSHEDDSDD